MNRVVLIGGLPGSGKTYLATLLMEYFCRGKYIWGEGCLLDDAIEGDLARIDDDIRLLIITSPFLLCETDQIRWGYAVQSKFGLNAELILFWGDHEKALENCIQRGYNATAERTLEYLVDKAYYPPWTYIFPLFQNEVSFKESFGELVKCLDKN